MSPFWQLLVYFVALMIWVSSVSAASLDKYGISRPAPTYQAPQQQIQRVSPYENQIRNAIRTLRTMTPDEQRIMLNEFRRRRDEASDNGRLEEAHYYNEIITRWNAER